MPDLVSILRRHTYHPLTVGYRVGDRVRGKYSNRSGTVKGLYPSGVSVLFDDRGYTMILLPGLHVEKL